ncbi:MAG TPA: DUF305 domain-containing protein [Dongiaceae bacterium]|nr:DUF305 domain-containing protein [Dongiaceae bacterium]
MRNSDRMEDQHGVHERPSHVERPHPDDPIFAAFGIDRAEAEAAQVAATPPSSSRRVLRSVLIAGLAVFGLAGGFFLWRESAMMAHAEALKAAAPANTAATALPGGDPFAAAMSKAMMDMHMAMDLPYTGNADRDFARMMIPHHQGAIDMAQLEMAYGKDPRLRRLAEEIIVTQQQEIAVMQLVLQDIAAAKATGAPGALPQQPAMEMTSPMQMNMDMPAGMQGQPAAPAAGVAGAAGNRGATAP